MRLPQPMNMSETKSKKLPNEQPVSLDLFAQKAAHLADHSGFLAMSAISFAAFVALFTLSGCGPQAFVAAPLTSSPAAPGNYTVPPKVDLVLIEDDTGSMAEVQTALHSQFPDFLTGLSNRRWDYRFTSISLTQRATIRQIVGSVFDPNWAGQWMAPFPGARPENLQTIQASLFAQPSQYSSWVPVGQTNLAANGIENGFENISQTVTGSDFTSKQVLRPDALLVFIMVGNGDDTSRVNICRRTDGIEVPCEDAGRSACTDINQAVGKYPGNNTQNPNCGSKQISFDYYKNRLAGLKPSSGMVQFHALVSASASRTCLSGNSTPGSRYMQMASSLGGQSYDICSQPMSTVLTNLSSNLTSTRLSMKSHYVVVDQAIDPARTTLTITRGGVAQTLPRVDANGQENWRYLGHKDDVYLISDPVPMNKTSGYMIELLGSNILVGTDSATVSAIQAGAQDSH